MLQWFADVIQPYTQSKPAALIVDTYAAHLTPAVRAAAAAINLELIEVPRGQTATRQPLDVSFNGPLKVRVDAYGRRTGVATHTKTTHNRRRLSVRKSATSR